MVSTPIKRANLRGAYAASLVAPVTTLLFQLELRENACCVVSTATATGQAVTSVSATNGAGGRSVSYSQPGREVTTTTSDSLLEMWSQLIDLHDSVKAALGGTPTDLAIKNEMMGLLVPAYEMRNDYTSLRTGLFVYP